LIQRLGFEGAVEWLEDEFKRMDRRRRETLELVQAVAVRLGWYLDDLLTIRTWHFGTTYREADFRLGRELTLNLQKQSASEVVNAWLTEVRGAPSPFSVEQLAQIPATEEAKLLKRRSLPASNAIGKDVPPLTSFDFSEVDRCAAETIKTTKAAAQSATGNGRIFGNQDPLSWWMEPLWYRRNLDEWADEQWWIRLATRRWAESKNQWAALVLMVNGYDEIRDELLGSIRFHEFWCSETFWDEPLWSLVDHLPWPIDCDDSFPNHPRVLGSPPPPIARPDAARCREALTEFLNAPSWDAKNEKRLILLDHASKLDLVSAAEWLEPGEIGQIHRECREWAFESNNYVTLRRLEPLATAAHFGWTDILDILDANPSFFAAQHEHDIIAVEPGKLALRLSLIAPGILAARYAAHSLVGDFSAIVDRLVEQLARSCNEEVRKSVQDMAARNRDLDRFAAAIAWQRCRASGLVGLY
jgi:hypothetical protein